MSSIVIDDPIQEGLEAAAVVVAPDEAGVGAEEPSNALVGWRNRMSRRRSYWPLAAVLVVQGVASLRLQNSAFQDEALYLWAGRLELRGALHGTPVFGEFVKYFSGAPGVYPVLGSVVDHWFGLAGARLLSLAFMMLATTCLFAMTRQLFGERPATLAAVAFGLSAPVLFIGHLATFDAMCLALLAVASWASVRASRSGRWPTAALVGALLLVAALTKYAGALFIPTVLAILGLETNREKGMRRAVSQVLVALGAAAAVAALVAARFGTRFLHGMSQTTTARKVFVSTGAWTLIGKFLLIGGVVAVLAVVGLFVVPRGRRALAVVLAGSTFLAPAYHVRTGELVSFHKHIGFGLFFAAPLAGLALARLVTERRGHFRGSRFAAAVALGVVAIAVALTQSSKLYHDWANSDQLVTALRAVAHPSSGRILAEEAEVPRYRLQGLVADWQWTDLNWFELDAGGRHLSGADAYRAAIDAHYFDVVVLRYGANAAMAHVIADEIERVGHYELVAQPPGSNGSQYSVYRSTAPATSTP
jgi:4-amino-4-deoxy-L-arabinose transferase-like glycosyltransferase